MDGTYGDISFNKQQTQRLKAIFAEGVCDYTAQPIGQLTSASH
ncbi:MAG: DUF6351 family protein [Pontibacterium sp.]